MVIRRAKMIAAGIVSWFLVSAGYGYNQFSYERMPSGSACYEAASDTLMGFIAMKMPLAWHADCLKNVRLSVERAQGEAQRANENAKRLQDALAVYATQIEEARKQGLDGFDSERFLKKRDKRI